VLQSIGSNNDYPNGDKTMPINDAKLQNKPNQQAPRPQRQTSQQQQEVPTGQALALPNQDKVILMKLVQSTQSGMSNIDRAIEKRNAILAKHFDDSLAESDRKFAEHVRASMPEGAGEDFLEEGDGWDNLDDIFDRLLTSPAPEEEAPPSESTIDVSATLGEPSLSPVA
jgi:hypothetical protein